MVIIIYFSVFLLCYYNNINNCNSDMRADTLTWTGNLLCHIQLFYLLNYTHLIKNKLKILITLFYSGMIRTFNYKYQKFMTYLLVHRIF